MQLIRPVFVCTILAKSTQVRIIFDKSALNLFRLWVYVKIYHDQSCNIYSKATAVKLLKSSCNPNLFILEFTLNFR